MVPKRTEDRKARKGNSVLGCLCELLLDVERLHHDPICDLIVNQSVETNRRPARPLDVQWEFGGASHAPPFLSAAVAHLCRPSVRLDMENHPIVEIKKERRLRRVTVDEVWALIEPVEQLPRWFSGSETAQLLGGQGLGRRQRLGGRWGHRRFEIDQTVTAYEPKRVLAWRHDTERLDGKSAPKISADTEFQIELEAMGQDVLIRLRSRQVPGNWFKGLVVRLIAARQIARMMDGSLDRLGRTFSHNPNDDTTKA